MKFVTLAIEQYCPLTFNLVYASGSTSLASEMNDLEAQAKQVGITINLTVQAPDAITGAATPCTPNQPLCKWQAADWNSGWVYADPYFSANSFTYLTPEASYLVK